MPLTHNDTDADRDVPSQIPSMLLRPAQAAVKPPEQILPPTNPVAKKLTDAYLFLEQIIERRAAGDQTVTDKQVRDAQAKLATAEDAVTKEQRRVKREHEMTARANAKVAEQRARALRATMRDAEMAARTSIAPVLTLRYRGLTVTCHPEKSLDQTSRLFAMNGFADALQVVRTDFERALNPVLTSAQGLAATLQPMSMERLDAEIREVARRAISRGLLTVTRSRVRKAS